MAGAGRVRGRAARCAGVRARRVSTRGVLRLAIFGKKKDGEASEAVEQAGPVTMSPEKAARFFEHARTVQQASNHEYAMQLWLNGLRQDPSSMTGLEGFWSAATSWNGAGNKKLSKETARAFGGRGDVEKYLAALLAWGTKPVDSGAAIRAADAAGKLDLPEPTYWIAEQALRLMAADPKPKKDSFVKLMRALEKIGAYDLAARAGDAAVRLDPEDNALATEVRNLSAQATMSRGGFDETGEAGGFRKNIRNADKQRELEEAERIVKSEDTLDRLVRLAEEAYKARPDDLPTITTYAKRLIERGTTEDEERALAVLKKAHADTQQFRFRQMAGDVRIRRARRRLGEFRKAAESAGGEGEAAVRFKAAQKKFFEIEREELVARVENYPTDLGLKHQLGLREFALGNFEDSVALFQESKGDKKSQASSIEHLGLAFQRMGWLSEAVDTLRDGVDRNVAETSEGQMAMRYALMAALQEKAERDREADAAKEAEKIASAIAIQQLNYRDIRARRDALKALVAELGA